MPFEPDGYIGRSAESLRSYALIGPAAGAKLDRGATVRERNRYCFFSTQRAGVVVYRAGVVVYLDPRD